MKRIFLLMLLVSVIPSVHALGISLQKSSLLPYETFVAEINGEFTNPLDVKNIFFINKDTEKEIQLPFYLLEITRQRYYVWVNMPETAGNYRFAIKNALYNEGGTLKGDEKSIDFEIKSSLSSAYKSLQTINWQSLSVQDTALTLTALSYDLVLTSAGKNALLSKTNYGTCWPYSSCNTADTALALFALAKIKATTKTQWIVDAQNNLDIGLWDLAINSDSAKSCDYLINTERKTANLSTGANTFSLDLKNKAEEVRILVNCSVTSAKIVHTYSGSINEFQLQQQSNSASISLNNKKCFGSGYRTGCDVISTAYAALVLDALGLEKSKAVDWLEKNAQKTRERAIALYLRDSSELREWLVNNMHTDGYWSDSALSESQEANFAATVYATMALEERGVAGGREWLRKELFNANASEKVLALSFIFPYAEIEPVLSFNPAVAKTNAGSKIEIEIKNRGVSEINASLNLLAAKQMQDVSIKQDKSAKITLTAPTLKEELGNTTISIEYGMKFSGKNHFNIPVFVAIENVSAPPTPQPVPEHFYFTPTSIPYARILVGDTRPILLTLKNIGQSDTDKVGITYTRDLRDIINITPTSFDKIEAGGERTIKVSILGKRAGNYSGSIIAVTIGKTANFSMNLEFTKNESLVNITAIPFTNKSCMQQNGTICKNSEICNVTIKTSDVEKCCIGSCMEKKRGVSTKMIGVLMLLAAVAILAIIFLPKLKRPKKEMKDVLAEIEKKYDKYSIKKQNFPA